MNDKELKQLVLKKYYEKRSQCDVLLTPEDFDNAISMDEITRISIELDKDDLIDAMIEYHGKDKPKLLGADITTKGTYTI